MDYIRQGATRRVEMRFFRDDLSVTVPVEWYYVPEDRNHVPYGHPFGSTDWNNDVGPRLLGEVPGTRSYYAGDHAGECAGVGLCGSKFQWENGASVMDEPLPLNPTTGRQCCCGRGVIANEVGIVPGIEIEKRAFPSAYNVDFGDAGSVVWEPFWGQDCCNAFSGLHSLDYFNFVAPDIWVYRSPTIECNQQVRNLTLIFFGPASGNLIRLQVSLPGTPANPSLWTAVFSDTDTTQPFPLLLTNPLFENSLCSNWPPLTVTMIPVY